MTIESSDGWDWQKKVNPVAVTHNGINNTLLQTRGMKKLPKSILECGYDPALLVNVIGGRALGGVNNGPHPSSIDAQIPPTVDVG